MSAIRVPRPEHLPPAQIGIGRTVAEPSRVGPDPLTEVLVGSHRLMQAVFRRIAFVAPTRASVLVVGEPGTETEALAHTIHAYSTRNHGPFVAFQTADRTTDDIEAALFGNVTEPKRGDGLLVGTTGGTLFLSEVTDLSLSMQARLLGVLDRHEAVPAGGFIPRAADVRVIAVTADPAEAIRSGQLRSDLAARLGVYPITLPPLRDRIEDVPALAEAVLRYFGVANPSERLTPGVLGALATRPWPGNVRELRDALAQALARSGDAPIRATHLPSPRLPADTADRFRALTGEWVRARTIDHREEPADLYQELRAVVEPTLLTEVLRQLGGRRLPASRWLGLTRATVRKMIRANAK
jgi:two-component system nitrogen regulation response regulator GlnG